MRRFGLRCGARPLAGWRQMLTLLLAASPATGKNPIVVGKGMADPHIHIFDDTAYLYVGHDRSPEATRFQMVDWNVWTSTDLVNWKHVTTISPNQTYMKDSPTLHPLQRRRVDLRYSGNQAAWACDVIEKDGTYGFFFSNGGTDLGVMLASNPALSDAKDALGHPLVSAKASPSYPEADTEVDDTEGAYDPTLLLDGDGSVYLCFGYRHPSLSSYMLARLEDSLDELAEEPRVVIVLPDPKTGDPMPGSDKPTLHIRHGVYYLSAGTFYATASHVYGPYTYRGATLPHSQKFRTFGLTGQAHGRFFTWHEQSFHVWCMFVDQNNSGVPVPGRTYHRWRESWMTYTHYGNNDTMVDDWRFLDRHGRTGVGQYDATWNKIEAEWYMQSTDCVKYQSDMDRPGSNLNRLNRYVNELHNSQQPEFAVNFLGATSTLTFPKVSNMPQRGTLTLSFSRPPSNGYMKVFGSAADEGQLFASCRLQDIIHNTTCPFERASGLSGDLQFRFEPEHSRRRIFRDDQQALDVPRKSGPSHGPSALQAQGSFSAKIEGAKLDWWSLSV